MNEWVLPSLFWVLGAGFGFSVALWIFGKRINRGAQ
jgi:hypothetical protein